MDKHGNTVGSRGSLSNQQKFILIGKILGDGCIEKNGYHARLKIEQCDKQKEYVFWFYQKMKPFVGQQPKIISHSGSNGKETWRWRFNTLSLNLFDSYYSLFYKNGKKIIPLNLSEYLNTPLALAVWYMDDGYLRTDKSGAYLCTSSFSHAENMHLQNILRKNFGIETNIHLAGRYLRLHIPSRSKNKFFRIIAPHICSCLNYKLPLTP